MARELSVVYGSTTLGGDTYPIVGPYTIRRTHEQFEIRFSFLVAHQTLATFLSNVSTVESAIQKPFQDLTVTQGGSNVYEFSQSSNTGMEAKGEILNQEEQEADTGRSRKYTVRITVELPATTGAERVTGLRDFSVSVEHISSDVRQITLTGIFTAQGGNSAREQYDDQLSTLETAILTTGLGITNWEVVGKPLTKESYNDKLLEFTHVYNELIFEQGASGTYDTEIFNQTLIVTRRLIAPGDSPRAKRLAEITMEYEAWIDKSNTDLTTKWSSIRSWLEDVANTTHGTGTLALIDSAPRYNKDKNQITATLTFVATNGSSVLEESVRVREPQDHGKIMHPAWTGRPHSKYVYPGPALRQRVVTRTAQVLGWVAPDPRELDSAGQSILTDALYTIQLFAGLEHVHNISEPNKVYRTIGMDGLTIRVTDIEQTETFTFFEPIDPGEGTIATEAA